MIIEIQDFVFTTEVKQKISCWILNSINNQLGLRVEDADYYAEWDIIFSLYLEERTYPWFLNFASKIEYS